MEIKIKKLDQADSDGFRELRLEFIEKYSASFGMETDSEAFKAIDFFRDKIVRNHILGAFDGDHMVGVIGFSRYKTSKEVHKGYIFSMGVTESYQGKGIGRKLFTQMLDDIKYDFPDVEQVGLKVEASNQPAHNFYLSLGFEEFGREKNALKIKGEYYDQIYMVKWMKSG